MGRYHTLFNELSRWYLVPCLEGISSYQCLLGVRILSITALAQTSLRVSETMVCTPAVNGIERTVHFTFRYLVSKHTANQDHLPFTTEMS